jgi:miniconductance mechanosensitive channel
MVRFCLMDRLLFEIDSLRLWMNDYPAAETAVALLAIGLIALLAFFVARRILLRLIEAGIRRSETLWDDALLDSNVLRRASVLAPLLVIHRGIDFIPHVATETEGTIQRVVVAAMIVVALMTFSSLLGAINDIYSRFDVSRGRPIKGYLQIIKIFSVIVGTVLIVALLLDRSPLYFVTGIGAMTAVLLLIFRDTILSLVASIQIMQNDMVRIGDWIEMPKYGADGDVIDIALHTVKVQNWDLTITTIPTYKLIEDSFKNWRGMTAAGGRRIKRAIHIDMTSVRFLDDEDVARFSRFVLLNEYMTGKQQEIAEYNAARDIEAKGLTANARRLTNLGTFRAYLINYLRQRPDIHTSGMTFLVRHLAPGPDGLPIEIYVFTKDTRWVRHEEIQADVFDHVLAMLPEFGLRVFQKPTGWDLARFQAAELTG